MLKAFAISGLIFLGLIAAAYEVFLWVQGLSGASEKFSAGNYKVRSKRLWWLLALYAAIFLTIYALIG